MILTYKKLVAAVEGGLITTYDGHPGFDYEQINAASIDVRLNRTVYFESRAKSSTIDLGIRQTPLLERREMAWDGSTVLAPGEFCLASTIEIFNLPADTSAWFTLKSSLARAGLDHSEAGWCDPGWHGSVLTLELRNNLHNHQLLLRAGMRIGQMIFFRGEEVPGHASYARRGQYNGDADTTPSKGSR